MMSLHYFGQSHSLPADFRCLVRLPRVFGSSLRRCCVDFGVSCTDFLCDSEFAFPGHAELSTNLIRTQPYRVIWAATPTRKILRSKFHARVRVTLCSVAGLPTELEVFSLKSRIAISWRSLTYLQCESGSANASMK